MYRLEPKFRAICKRLQKTAWIKQGIHLIKCPTRRAKWIILAVVSSSSSHSEQYKEVVSAYKFKWSSIGIGSRCCSWVVQPRIVVEGDWLETKK